RAGVEAGRQVRRDHGGVAAVGEQVVADVEDRAGVEAVDAPVLGAHLHPREGLAHLGGGVARARPAQGRGAVERHAPEVEAPPHASPTTVSSCGRVWSTSWPSSVTWMRSSIMIAPTSWP